MRLFFSLTHRHVFGTALKKAAGTPQDFLGAHGVRLDAEGGRFSHAALRSSMPGAGAVPEPDQEFDSELEGWFYRNRLSILISLLGSVLILGLGLRLLAPLLAQSLANNLPSSWIRSSSEHLLATLDVGPLQRTQIEESARIQLRLSFSNLTAPSEGAPPFRLIFRHSNTSSPLLLSLPSGDIVVTDRFFSLVQDPDQRLAMLCQELGHLQRQNSLREAVRHNLLWLASAAFVGSAHSSIEALSDGLLHSEYSFGQLQAADRYAHAMLRGNGFPDSLLAQVIAQFGDNTAPGKLTHPENLSMYREERLRALLAQP